MFKNHRQIISILFLMAVLLQSFGQYVAAQEDATKPKSWTLEASVERVLEVSPQVRAASAEIDARKGDLSQAKAWPNPELGFSVDQKLGIEDGNNGMDFTQIMVSQPIPLARISHQRKQAKAVLEAVNQDYFHLQLSQEAETARRFHELQLMTDKLRLAEEQLNFSKQYEQDNEGQNQDAIVRYLTPLEQKRLDIMRESASQELANAEGEYSEALAAYRALLYLTNEDAFDMEPLSPLDSIQSLESLLNLQGEKHPAILAAQYGEASANFGISLARVERLEDPSLIIFNERDSLAGERHHFIGMGLNFKLPLWDRKQGLVSKAKAEAEMSKYERMAIIQTLESQLRQSHLHIRHLIEQSEHYRKKLLAPVKEVFELTQKSFEVGEVNVLSLVDANNTYFDAHKRYAELLYETRVELAELRLAAGLSVLSNPDFSDDKEIGGAL